jgi:hypothetical protein
VGWGVAVARDVVEVGVGVEVFLLRAITPGVNGGVREATPTRRKPSDNSIRAATPTRSTPSDNTNWINFFIFIVLLPVPTR